MTMSVETEAVEFKEWRQREQGFLRYLEDVTSQPLAEQEKILKHILNKNAGTEYLQKHGLNGATDAKTFRERVPVSNYDSYRPYVDRVYAGDTSPLLSADPAVEILTSSGTSGGQPKLFPITQEDVDRRGHMWFVRKSLLNRALPGFETGKCLYFYFTRPPKLTPAGLPSLTAVTSVLTCPAYKNRLFDPSYRFTSPDEVIWAADSDQAMYCHLLLGLLQREDVFRVGAIFTAVIQKAVRYLEDAWQDIYDDIANGTLNPRVEDAVVRAAALPLLRKDPELAELVRREFSQKKASKGVLRRLWPNSKIIDTVCTGSMEAYLPAIANYSENLPVICAHMYCASECYIGINMSPMASPETIDYALIPFSAYFEFIPVDSDGHQSVESQADEIVDLSGVKDGQEYEVVVTTVSGLYRYRMGDILRVVGSYNSSPTFRFMRRANAILSIDTDKTDEKELYTAVTQGAKVLERECGVRFSDFSSTADFSSMPGHYVIFWELDTVPNSSASDSPRSEVLEQCCATMEANLNAIYRRGRHENLIGPLELRLAREGTFDLLANYAFSQGASLAQYKTPRGIDAKRTALLEILNSNVFESCFAPGKPPYSPVSSTPTREV